MGSRDETGKIEYHYGFYGAVRAEYDRADMEYLQEYELGDEPVRMDMLIIKHPSPPLQDPVGSFFRTYNVLEYKSPVDGLNENDFYKTLAYAFLYKGLSKKVDDVPVDELTVSIFRHRYPRELISRLSSSGYAVDEKYPGVYHISGPVRVAVQIVVTSRLRQEGYEAFKALASDATREDIMRLLSLADGTDNERMVDYVRAVLDVSMAINTKLFDEIREDSIMSGAVERYFKAEFEEKINEGIRIGEERGERRGIAIGEERGIAIGEERGIAIGEERGEKRGAERGEAKGRLLNMLELVEDGLISLTDAAQKAGMTPEEFREKAAALAAK